MSPTARLYELRVRDLDSGRWANFADVGFGIGQALPVLVEGLRTQPGGMFVVQEPEIHLHPDAQLAMADYLVELSRSGRRVIVETHSEALLLRIRRALLGKARYVGSKASLSVADVSIVYVSSHPNGASDTTALGLDKLGQVDGWPKGFMEEVTNERMNLLKAMAGESTKA
jgi:predicted ATPase